MTLDPRTPVLVGVGQIIQHPDINEHPEALAQTVEAIKLMEAAVEAAGQDSGAPDLLRKLNAVAVVDGAWGYGDPARLLANAVGSPGATTILSSTGGNTPQSLVNALAQRIQDGEMDVALLVGGETIWSRRKKKAAGLPRELTEQQDATPDERFQTEVQMSTSFEAERGMAMPVNFYPVFESAFRASRGEDLEAHRTRVAELWTTFNQAAVNNPYAWLRTPMTADQIRNPTADNRMIGFPYTKSMNSNWNLDQSAALLLCSASAADAAGVPRDRWVFPYAGTDAHDTYTVTERRDLHSSPAIAEAGKALFAMTDVDIDDVAHVDLYSCFPSAVQVSATELGLGLDRDLTVTGGLTFAGGPLNNYVSHSIATMAEVLRADASSIGLVTANGGYLTKHALGLYSTTPPPAPFRSHDVQSEVDKVASVAAAQDHVGQATIEGYTVMHDANGPQQALAAARTSAGGRTWSNSNNAEVMTELMTSEGVGRTIDVAPDGAFELV